MADLELKTQQTDGCTVHCLTGALTRTALPVLNELSVPDGHEARIEIDLSGIQTFDAFGAIRLLEIAASHDEGRISFKSTPKDLKAFLLKIPFSTLFDGPEKIRPDLLESLGGWLIRAGDGMVHFFALGLEFLYWIGVAPFRGRKIYINRTIHEFYLIGAEAVPIVGLISLLMGAILALNAAYQLEQFGARIFVANLVAVSMTRELGPIMTAIIVAGRTGSAIAAEFGTMIVTEEIDALKVTGIHPTAFLTVPKLLALMLAMPCLVILSDVLAMTGGLGISLSVMEIGCTPYLQQTREALLGADVLIGLFKGACFGLLIGLTGATLGMRLRGGAEEVGKVTTAAVVISFFLVIMADMVFSLFFTWIGI
ncbi:MAG: ABC transporter permease [Planctomycetes bacterium]|nr:ABC transporter permease [Planctomycetota bacterium]